MNTVTVARAYEPQALGAQCERCPLQGRDPVPAALARGDRPRLLVVGMNPGTLEENRGIPFCLAPETKVLMADLTWKSLGDVVLSDEVVGVDEHPPFGPGVSGRAARQWKIGRVTAVFHRRASRKRVVTEIGELIATGDHRVLSAFKKVTAEGTRLGRRWSEINDLVCGPERRSNIVHIGHRPWTRMTSYDAGWLAGFLDGEGHINGSRSARVKRAGVVGFSQNEGPILARAESIVTDFGFHMRRAEKGDSRIRSGNLCVARNMAGDLPNSMRFLGMLGPERLITDFRRVLYREDTARPSIRNLPAVRLMAKEKFGVGDVVDIATTCGSFIADGFVVHNCGPSGRLLDSCLEEAGFSRDEAHITNAALCRSNDDMALKRAVPCCAPRLARELAAYPGVPILALGAESLRPLLGKGAIMKTRGFVWTTPQIRDQSVRNCERNLENRIKRRKNVDKIENARDSLALIQARKLIGGRIIIPSVHPAMILRGADGWLPVLRIDIRRAVRFVESGGKMPMEDIVPFTRTRDPAVARRLLATMSGVINVDIETKGNEPMVVPLTCVGVADVEHLRRFLDGKIPRIDPRRIVIMDPWHDGLLPVLREAVADREVITHNGPAFDEIVCNRFGIRWKKRNDTLIAHYSYASDKPKSLAFVSSIYNDSTPWKTRFKQGDEEKGVAGFGVKAEDLAAYNAADVALGSFAWIRMQADLNGERKVYEHDIRHALLCQRMQTNGLLVDGARRKDLSVRLRRRSAALLGEMRRLLKRRGFSPSKPNDIRKALFQQLKTPLYLARATPTGLTAVNAELFERLKQGENRAAKLAGLIVDWRKANDIKSEYLDNLWIGPKGRIYPHWRSYGTQCMPAKELVLTSRGYLPVEKVRSGDQVITHRGRVRRVVAVCQNPPEPIIRVGLANGLMLRTNHDHPYYSNGDWVPAIRLCIGQGVVVHSGPEAWKFVPDWPYEVSSWGRLRGIKGEPLAIQRKDEWGHLKVTFRRRNVRSRGEDVRDFAVHRLVMQNHRPVGEGEEVRHLNGIAWDNTVANLAWGTCLENKADARRHGTMSKRSRTAKLTQAGVDRIRSVDGDYYSDVRFAEELGVSRELVRDVRLGKRWLLEDHVEGRVVRFNESEVVSIVHEPAEATYGLTVEEDESHVTGGIVTHNTGRPATHKPNILNIPRLQYCAGCGVPLIDGVTHKEGCKKRMQPMAEYQVRDIYIAAPGHVFIYFDLSQAEMRFAANISGDDAFIESCKGDVHAGNARILFRNVPGALELLQDPKGKGKKFRDIAKNCGFAITYCAEADKLYTHLVEHGYGEYVDLDICQDAIDAIRSAYWRYFEYVDQNVALCRRYGYLRTAFLGRKRWLGKLPKPTDVSNFPIQSGVADVMNERLAIIDQRQAKRIRHVVYQYDSSIYETPEDLVDQHMALIKDVWAEPIRVPHNGREFHQPIDLKSGRRLSDFG